MTAQEYEQRANAHRPNDPEKIAAEIQRLIATGLKPRDVAMALRVDLSAVLTALRQSSPGAGIDRSGSSDSPLRDSTDDRAF